MCPLAARSPKGGPGRELSKVGTRESGWRTEVPEQERRVAAGAGEAGAGWRERDIVDKVLVPREAANLLDFLQVPDANRRVVTTGREQIPSGRQRDGEDLPDMAP